MRSGNMRIIVYGDLGGSGGYIRYCKGLFGSKSTPKDIELWFICSKPFYQQLQPLDPEIHIITHPWMKSNYRIHRYLWYLWIYPRIVKKIKPNAEFYPLGQLRVYLRKALTITTCHNLLLFDERELELIEDKKEQLSFQSYRKNQIRSFQKSNGVVYLSNHSQKVVNKHIGGIKKSMVISHGLDPIFLLPESRLYNFKNSIKLLYVSPFYNYKHQIEVIKAVKLLRVSTRLDIRLNLIGGGKSTYAFKLEDFIKKSDFHDFIIISANMNYEDLVKEYRSADMFIFASSCETFGITILEAMGSRLPIACSNRTGLPDILKDAGVYFDPEDPKSIAEALQKLIQDKELRKTLGERAYRYSLDYTWERCASETFNYIKKLE
jgi:glycosyltransferase involved in cell wall biosynthesis